MISLRKQLSRRYAATMLVALLAIALWAWWGVRRTLFDETERALVRASRLQVDVLEAYGAPAPFGGPADLAQLRAAENRFVVVRDGTGRLLAANADVARGLPFDSAAFRRALAGDVVVRTVPWATDRVLTVYRRVETGRAAGGVLELGASLADIDLAADRTLLRMIVTALLGASAALVGARWLAGSALAPVDAIARQARAISPTEVGHRITTHADTTEFRGLVEVLNGMLDRLEAGSAWHRRIIRDLGHDLRTPITAMRMGVEVALWSDRTPDEYRRVLAGVNDAVERLVLISDALNFLGRLQTGDVQPALAPVDARTVLNAAAGRARQRLSTRRFDVALPATPIHVEADERLLGQALDQLTDNAMRHTPGGTTITLSARARDGRVELVVEDDGPGVPEEQLSQLFDVFYRSDPARGRDAGPGLGLTTVAAIVSLHGGSASAERADGGGLRVRLSFPAGAPASAPRAVATA